MYKLLDYVYPALGVIVIIILFGGYYYLSSSSGPAETSPTILKDRKYLSSNQDRYADCHRTIKLGDPSIHTITNRLFNEGVSQQKLEALESEFTSKFREECEPLLSDYEARYDKYVKHRKEAAKAQLTILDQISGQEAEVISDPSPILHIYQRYEPESLQYPTNSRAKMLYTEDDYESYIQQNL